MDNSIQQKQIILNNLLITYYFLEGKEDKKIIFLHGWRSESKVWFDLMKKLNLQGYSTYAIDLPGFGKSQIPSQSLNLEDYANCVIEFITKLKLDKIVLIGHSHGGRTAIKAVLINSHSINKLVLVDSSGIKLNKNKINLSSKIAKIVKPIFKLGFMINIRKNIYLKIIGNEDYVATPELNQTYLNIISEDLTDQLSTIDKPTLLIWGELDKDTPIEVGNKMKQKINNSDLYIIRKAGHYSFLDQPQQFFDVLINFLNK